MNEEAKEGATPEPPKNLDKCMGLHRHGWMWIWEKDNNGKSAPADRIRCMNCDEERVVKGCNGPTVL